MSKQTVADRLNFMKNTDVVYKGNPYHVKTWAVMEGQVHIITKTKTIQIDKSKIEKELSLFKVPHMNGTDGKTDQKWNASDDVPVDQFFVTSDYGRFVLHEKNRNVNAAHVSNLVQSISKQDLLFAQPILVNENYEVIDGQHRLAAADQLGRKIYYIKKEGLTIEDAIALNVNTKNWSYRDYMHHWIAQGKEEYKTFRDYMDHYQISYSLCVGLLMSGRATSGNQFTKAFNNGEFEVKYKDYALRLGEMTMDMAKFGSFTTDRSFIMALDQALQMDAFDYGIFMKKLTLCPDKFTKCSDSDSYLRMMEDVINYHGKGERIRLY